MSDLRCNISTHYCYLCRYSKVKFVDQHALHHAKLPMDLNKFEELVLKQCAEARSILQNE